MKTSYNVVEVPRVDISEHVTLTMTKDEFHTLIRIALDSRMAESSDIYAALRAAEEEVENTKTMMNTHGT